MAYYPRLEQGQSANASDAVLRAIAGALRPSTDERSHLLNLAGPARSGRRTASRPSVAGPAEDPVPPRTIGELTMKGEEFAALPARYPVRACAAGIKDFPHPLVGPLRLPGSPVRTSAGGRVVDDRQESATG
ncbi:MmyB family transcriptional regulator [Streptomyces orinoci]|uniref:MmyB-like transcription regulator ligand binding domain-containing protein n=1 Tax=Streptomyces orinoci TaxID=67339 RepID=A0ABV3K744_STRON|nr:hypothetical protein [Streptomyces orinoci]